MFRNLFRYPDPVDESAARLLATGVVALVAVYLFTGSGIVLGFLAYGFVARVLAGPVFSPLAQIVNRLLVPWFSIPAKPVPGPPKRFAQLIGAVLSVGALVAQLAGFPALAILPVAAIGVAATLESVLVFCIGCWVFARLMAAGLVPASVCEACTHVSMTGTDEHLSAKSSIG